MTRILQAMTTTSETKRGKKLAEPARTENIHGTGTIDLVGHFAVEKGEVGRSRLVPSTTLVRFIFDVVSCSISEGQNQHGEQDNKNARDTARGGAKAFRITINHTIQESRTLSTEPGVVLQTLENISRPGPRRTWT